MKKIIIFAIIGCLMATVAYALPVFKINRSQMGDQTFAIPKGYINTFVLTADSAKTVAIPSGATYALFAATTDIWVRIGAAAEVPSGDTTDGTGAELNPSIRWIQGESSISVISEYAAKVSITFYQ